MAEQSDTVHGPVRMWLTVFSGPTPKHTVEVARERFLIGRDESCDLTLEDPKVSREHAAILKSAGPFHVIRDLGSANGTLVNGQPVRAPLGFGVNQVAETKLSGDEWLRFGDTPVLVSLFDPSQIPSGLSGTRGLEPGNPTSEGENPELG
jgi:pSer/pThr/pTyr-binding forkhead associated (FHA) protein